MESHAPFRRLLAAVVVALSALVTAVASPSAASAASYGWNYISLPTWLNNCPGGGSVKEVRVVVGTTWSGGDAGDDLVYAKVTMNANQTVIATGRCVIGTFSYWGPASSNTIRPTRQNQTWWVGPDGVRHN